MVFQKKGCLKTSQILVSLGEVDIERLVVLKYLNLGVNFSGYGSFSKQMDFVLIKAQKVAFTFWKYINRFVTMKFSLILNVFQTLVMPMIL